MGLIVSYIVIMSHGFIASVSHGSGLIQLQNLASVFSELLGVNGLRCDGICTLGFSKCAYFYFFPSFIVLLTVITISSF